MKNKISVIIPAYNSSLYICDALDSVYNQTALNLINEVIVINDGSTDDTLKKLEEYKKKLNNNLPELIIYDQENSGVSKSRNIGVSLSKSKWIAFLDSDDEWFENKIEYQCKVIDSVGEENIDCLGGSFENDYLKILLKKYTNLFKANIKQICIKNFPQPSTAMIKKDVFEEIGGFDINHSYAEDGEFFLKIAYLYNLYYDPKCILYFGHGKRGFGASGLSSNMKEMHAGNLRNIKTLKNNKWISNIFYIFLRIFFQLKYFRRVLITIMKGFV